MLNNVFTLKLKVLLALLAGSAIVSGAITYTIINFISAGTRPASQTICPTITTSTQSAPIAREKYFKVHKAKLDGERF